jgi:hypothetical protein
MLVELRRQVEDALSDALGAAGYSADADGLGLEKPLEGVDADVA